MQRRNFATAPGRVQRLHAIRTVSRKGGGRRGLASRCAKGPLYASLQLESQRSKRGSLALGSFGVSRHDKVAFVAASVSWRMDNGLLLHCPPSQTETSKSWGCVSSQTLLITPSLWLLACRKCCKSWDLHQMLKQSGTSSKLQQRQPLKLKILLFWEVFC